jgi:hypothetical protein
MEKRSMDEIFHNYLPDNLFRSHYELAQMFGYKPQEWRKYLRENQIFIDSELAAIAEAEARNALSRLGNASSSEVSAFKAILENSQLINNAQKQATKIVITHIPKTEER